MQLIHQDHDQLFVHSSKNSIVCLPIAWMKNKPDQVGIKNDNGGNRNEGDKKKQNKDEGQHHRFACRLLSLGKNGQIIIDTKIGKIERRKIKYKTISSQVASITFCFICDGRVLLCSFHKRLSFEVHVCCLTGRSLRMRLISFQIVMRIERSKIRHSCRSFRHLCLNCPHCPENGLKHD